MTTILVVDDRALDRKYLRALLSHSGFEVIEARDGAEALVAVLEKRPNLVISDLLMPEVDGFEFVRRMRQRAEIAATPVLFYTATYRAAEAQALAADCGVIEILPKPAEPGDLLKKVEQMLEQPPAVVAGTPPDFYERYARLLRDKLDRKVHDLEVALENVQRTETRLELAAERTNIVMETARVGIWNLDLVTNSLVWSDSLSVVFGLDPELTPKTLDEFRPLVYPEDRQRVNDAFEAAIRTGADFSAQFRTLDSDGKIRWIYGRAKFQRDDSGRPVRCVGVGVDVSDRIELELQLRQVQKLESIGQLAAGVAHDFNNILTAILGYTELIVESFPDGDQRRADLIDVIAAARRGTSLTRQLLTFSRRQVLDPKSVDLNGIVEDLRPMLRRLIGERIELQAKLGPRLSHVWADTGQLDQMIMNLAVNARDAMPSGGRLIIETANVELAESLVGAHATVPPGRYVRLAVSDTGIGMDRQTKDRLFEPFFTTKAAGKGTGLGLATVYGIVRQSDGYVLVESAPNEGARFEIYFPPADQAKSAVA